MENLEEGPIIDDTQLWQNNLSKHETTCLGLGVRFKLFDILKSEGALSREDLIKKSGLGNRGGHAILAVLASLKYLKISNGKYDLTDISRNFLTSDSPNSFTPMLDYSMRMSKSDFQLEAALKADQSGSQEWEIIKMWQEGNISPEMAAGFTLIMQVVSKTASRVLAEKFDLKSHGIDSILDVAGGSGCYSIQFARKQPGIRSTVLELNEVCKVAQTYIDRANCGNQVVTYPCNMFKEPFPSHLDAKHGYKAIFMSQILHDWDERVGKMLCDKAYAALPEGGSILIHEALLNDEQDGPLVTALLSFDFFITSNGGKQYSFAEIRDLLTSSGFKDVNVIKTYGIFSLIYAKK